MNVYHQAILAAVVSAVLHAGWNALVKATPDPRSATLLTLTGAFVCVWLGVFAFWSFGVQAERSLTPWVLVAGLGEVAYVWSLGKALERGPLGLTYALSRATAMLLVWPLSYAVFGATITLFGILGSLLVIAGITLMRPNAGQGGIAFGPTLLSGLSVGVYHTGYKGCVRAGMPFALAFAYALLVAVPLLWILLGSRLHRSARAVLLGAPLRIVASSLGCAGSFLLAVWALTRADSGVVLGLRNSSIGFGVLFGVFLGERLRAVDALGLACFGVSVVLFAMG